MKIRKSLFVFMVFLLSMTLLLAGCGNTTGPTATVSQTSTGSVSATTSVDNIPKGSIAFWGSVTCAEKCAKVEKELNDNGIPFQLWEINPIISPTTAYESYDVLIKVLRALNPPDKPTLPIALYFSDTGSIKGVSIGIVEPTKIIDIYKKALENTSPYLYMKNATVKITSTQMQAVENLVGQWQRVKKPTLKQMQDVYVELESLQMPSATDTVKDGFLVFGTTSCPYTKGMYLWLKKTYGEDHVRFIDVSRYSDEYGKLTTVLFGKEAEGIPLVMAFRGGRPVLAWIGFRPPSYIKSYLETYQDGFYVWKEDAFQRVEEDIAEKSLKIIDDMLQR